MKSREIRYDPVMEQNKRLRDAVFESISALWIVPMVMSGVIWGYLAFAAVAVPLLVMGVYWSMCNIRYMRYCEPEAYSSMVQWYERRITSPLTCLRSIIRNK